MFLRTLRLLRQLERLEQENEQLRGQLRQERRMARQWENLMSYTGKAQEDNLDEDE